MPASKKKPTKRKLTDKRRLFVTEYLVDRNATQAAIRAGFSAKTADRIGPELLGISCVKEALEDALRAQERRIEITADRILQELALIAFCDPRHYMEIEPDGNVRILSFDEMPEGASRTIKGVKASHKIKENAVAGEKTDKPTETVTLYSSLEYTHHDKMKALELLGKNKKLFIDVKEHRGKVDLITPTGLQELKEILGEIRGK